MQFWAMNSDEKLSYFDIFVEKDDDGVLPEVKLWF